MASKELDLIYWWNIAFRTTLRFKNFRIKTPSGNFEKTGIRFGLKDEKGFTLENGKTREREWEWEREREKDRDRESESESSQIDSFGFL